MPRANEVTSYTLNSGNASTAPIDALMSRSVNPVDNHLQNDPTNPRLRNFIGYTEFTLSPLHLEWIKTDEHIFPLEGHLLLSGNHTNGAGGRGQIRYSPEENVVWTDTPYRIAAVFFGLDISKGQLSHVADYGPVLTRA